MIDSVTKHKRKQIKAVAAEMTANTASRQFFQCRMKTLLSNAASQTEKLSFEVRCGGGGQGAGAAVEVGG